MPKRMTEVGEYKIVIRHKGLSRDFEVFVNSSIYSKAQADKAKMLVEEILDVIYTAESVTSSFISSKLPLRANIW